jgi:hypothetical protein
MPTQDPALVSKRRHKLTFVLLACLAMGCFIYAVCTLGFQVGNYSCQQQRVNAGVLAAVWAIGPPIWFMLERQIWENLVDPKKLDTDQDHARDFWLGLGAIVLFLADKRW